MHRKDEERAKARCYQKAVRRGLSFRSRWDAKRGVSRYHIIRDGDFEVWWADHIGDAEAYLDKAPPRLWVD